jgi:hypothetical protein
MNTKKRIEKKYQNILNKLYLIPLMPNASESA